jgi:N-acetylglucosaminyldiphosphoundecaprenol N-acetyl-beta-D-mannosaminyltransferase
LRERYPSLEIAGTHHGYFDKDPTSVSNSHVVELINSASPDILLVGFGMPIQEQWLKDNWETIEARAAITGGAVLDYTSGALRRGPRLLTDHGLEWLARLLIEPRRLWRRYVIGNPMFLARVLRQRSAGKSRFQQ